jgi:heat shock factor-binding protein 1
MVDHSKSPSPDKLDSSPPEGESLLSQPVYTFCVLRTPLNALTKCPQNSDAQGQLTAAVDDLLNELQTKFDKVSTEMFGKRESMLQYPLPSPPIRSHTCDCELTYVYVQWMT